MKNTQLQFKSVSCLIVISVAITKYFFTKYFTLNTLLEKSTRTKYFVNFGI